MDERQRREAFEQAAIGLPTLDMTAWFWTEQEVDVLRKACAVRFNETLRTESLFKVAATGMRILLARQMGVSWPEADHA